MRLLDEGSVKVPRYQIITSKGGNFAPVRPHSRHRNGGKESYHHRIQKKWLKRFGERWVEIQKRGEVFILGGSTVVVREDDLPELDRLLGNCR
jgi:hypothetical protein